MSKKPLPEEQKPLANPEPVVQPENQRDSEIKPRDDYSPYVPIEKRGKAQDRQTFSASRRELIGLLAILGVWFATRALQAPVFPATRAPQSVIAAPSTPGCQLVGDTSADLTIEEYTDFACPFCSRFASMVEDMKRDFGPRVRIVYRNLPRPAHGPIAETAARAFTSVCLQNPAVAYSYYRELLAHQNNLFSGGAAFLYETAEKLNIDVKQMKSDMASKTVLDQVEQDKVRAKESGLVLSPSWIIGMQGLNGTYEYPYMKQVIESQLRR
jgi:predicted DsbA family dithiol-disulfide isomerase